VCSQERRSLPRPLCLQQHHSVADRVADALCHCEIFRTVDANDLQQVALSSAVRTHAEGCIVYPAYRTGEQLTVVMDGVLALYGTTPGGKRLVLGRFRRGDWFGIAPICGAHSDCQELVAWEEGATAVHVPAAWIQGRLSADVTFCQHVTQLLAGRFTTLAEHLLHVAFQPLKERVAALLIQLADESDGITVSCTNRVLADCVGVDAAEVSKVLKQLCAEGVLHKEPYRSTITIVDRVRLGELAA
jgi:CRP/FNR family transcriptional regulator, polysaccharide utilization system transcription regulator